MIDFDLDDCVYIYTGEKFISWLSLMPGVRWNRNGIFARIPLTPFHSGVISRKETNITESAKGIIEANLKDEQEFLARLRGEIPPSNFAAPHKLFRHQETGIHALQQMSYNGLLTDEMGLGKTQTAISCYKTILDANLVVVCTASIKWKWAQELEANGIPSWIVTGKADPRKWTKGTAVIVNYDLLARRESLVDELEAVVDGGFLILDESHYVKDSKSKRTKACKKLAQLAKYKLLLTGTPVRNTILDLFSQVDIVRPGMWRNKFEFEDRYFIRKEMRINGRAFMKPIGTKNEEELNAIMSTTQVRRLKADVMDLPPKIHTVIPLELDKESREIYTKMADKWLYDYRDLGGDTPLLDQRARSAMEAAMRLEQICQGFLGPIPETILDKLDANTPAGKSKPEIIRGGVIYPGNPKFKWLTEMLEEANNLVLFFKFNTSLFAVESLLTVGEVGHVWMTGETSQGERQSNISAFQAGKVRVFLCQVKIAEGFDLTATQHCAFWGRDWSPAVNSQAEDRLHRIGQTGTVNIYIPIIKDSIEERLQAVLAEKQGIANLILGDIRKAIKETV